VRGAERSKAARCQYDGDRRRVAPRRRLLTRVALGCLIACALVLVGGPASAHAVLEQSDPAPDAVLQQVPAQVVLRFDEAVTLLPTSVQVTGPDGSRVDTGAADHAGGDATTAAVPLDHAEQHVTYLV
jgi:copper transport protein